jgi:hypothetical protein
MGIMMQWCLEQSAMLPGSEKCYLTVRRSIPRSFCREYLACKRVCKIIAKVAESRRLHVLSWFSSAETIVMTSVSRTYFLLVRTVFNSAFTALMRLVAILRIISCPATSSGILIHTWYCPFSSRQVRSSERVTQLGQLLLRLSYLEASLMFTLYFPVEVDSSIQSSKNVQLLP